MHLSKCNVINKTCNLLLICKERKKKVEGKKQEYKTYQILQGTKENDHNF